MKKATISRNIGSQQFTVIPGVQLLMNEDDYLQALAWPFLFQQSVLPIVSFQRASDTLHFCLNLWTVISVHFVSFWHNVFLYALL